VTICLKNTPCITGVVFISLHKRAANFLAYFCAFFANFVTVKKLSRNLSARIILVPDAIFVLHLTFLTFSVLRYRLEKKTVTQPESDPAYFAIREHH